MLRTVDNLAWVTPLLADTSFSPWDWVIVGVYLVVVVAVGAIVGRTNRTKDEFFLASRQMPVWAVALSVLATSQSAATFIGGPQQAYVGNLTYFAGNLGALIAVLIVGLVFLPVFYRQGVTSIYEVVGHTCGPVAQKCASGMFMVGRVFASGARLYIVGIPFSLIAFGDIEPAQMMFSLIIIASGATIYTVLGGIRAVIWTDVLQSIVYISTVVVALIILWNKIPLSATETFDALKTTSDGNKLTLINTSLSLTEPWTIWSIVFGMTLFNLAAYGTDQDLAQRMLTCRTARSGMWAIIWANIVTWPVLLLFLAIGLLLAIFYGMPELMGDAGGRLPDNDTRKVFLVFILEELPTGIRGLMLAGLFAAAMSSIDSALNAMASTSVADFYRPWHRWRHQRDPAPASELRVSRFAVVVWAVTLALFAMGCVLVQHNAENRVSLIDFALGVMVFAYSGLLGVFLTILLTPRGNAWSAIAALIVGFIAVWLLQQDFMRIEVETAVYRPLWFGWQMLVATSLSFFVCAMGSRGPGQATKTVS
ncbi:MAG: hypothetical protein P8J86_08700 [Phycisphaerales bacterium]|nr:hypothetical protein [Phycisphaerales bacterium]